MKNGQLKFWWHNGIKSTDIFVNNLAEGIFLYNTFAKIEVDDDTIPFNVGGISYYNQEFLKPEYDCKDGFVDFYDNNGRELSRLVDELYEYVDKSWKEVSYTDIVAFLQENNILGESSTITIY